MGAFADRLLGLAQPQATAPVEEEVGPPEPTAPAPSGFGARLSALAAPAQNVGTPAQLPTFGARLQALAPQQGDPFVGPPAPGAPGAQAPANPLVFSDEVQSVLSGILGTTAAGLRAVPAITSTSQDPGWINSTLLEAAESVQGASEQFAQPGIKGTALATAGGAAPFFVPGIGYPLAAAAIFDSSYQSAVAGGANKVQARRAAFASMIPMAALEYLKIRKVKQAAAAIGKIAQPGLRKAQQWALETLRAAGWQGVGGGGQQVVRNAIQNYYDPETDVFDAEAATRGVLQQGALDAAGYGILSAAGGGVRQLQNRRKPPTQAPPAETAPKTAPDAPGRAIDPEAAPRPGTVEKADPATADADLAKAEAEMRQANVPETGDGLPLIPRANAVPAGPIDEVVNAGTKVADGLREIGDSIYAIEKGVMERFFSDEATAVEGLGSPQATLLSTKMRYFNDAYNRLRARIQEPVAKWLEPLAGRTRKSRKVVDELNKTDWYGDSGFTRFRSSVEGVDSRLELSPEAQQAVTEFRKLSRMMADQAVERGVTVKRTDPTTGDVVDVPFQGEPQGKRIPRAYTSEFWEIVKHGTGHPYYEKFVGEIARLNNLPPEAVRSEMDVLRTQALSRQSPFEVERVWKTVPDYIRMFDGHEIPILNSDVHGAARSMLGGQASRLAFIEEFGQNPAVIQTWMEDLQRYHGELGVRSGERVFRLMNGLPVDLPEYVLTGAPGNHVMRAGRAAGSIFRTLKLLTSFVQQAAETAYTVPQTAGVKHWAKALPRMMTDPTTAGYAELGLNRVMGQALEVPNYNWDPKNLYESIDRIASNIGLAPLRLGNSFSEALMSQANLMRIADMHQGRGTLFDRMTLERLRFNERDINMMMDGSAGRDLYEAAWHRMNETGTSKRAHPITTSRMTKNRAFNNLFWFMRYGMKITGTTTDLFADVKRSSWEVFRGAGTPPGKFGQQLPPRKWVKSSEGEDLKRLGTAIGRLSAFAGGGLAAGALTLTTLNTMRYGIRGAEATFEEAGMDWRDFFDSVIVSQMFGGGVTNARSLFSGEESAFSILEEQAGALNTWQDVSNAMKAKGPYSDMEGIEKWSKFLQRNVSAAKPIRTMAYMLGLGDSDPKMDLALRLHYKWLRTNVGTIHLERTSPKMESDYVKNQETFRKGMKKIAWAVKNNKSASEMAPLIQQIFAEGGDAMVPKQAAASLRGRKVLTHVPKNAAVQEKYLKQMPRDLHEKLMAHDHMLESWAKAIYPTE